MRLTFVINSLAAGGAQRVLTDLMGRLVERGHEVALVTYSKKERDHFKVPKGVTRIELNLLWDSRHLFHALASNIRRLKILRSTLVISRPDVVVSFIDLTNVLTLVSMAGSGIPIVVSERIHPRHHPIGWHWRLARRLTYFLCASLVVQTRDIALWARGCVPAKKIIVIPNPAPDVVCEASNTVREKILLAVGRLNTQKGFDLLLRAFHESGIWRDGWRAVVIGEGPERSRLSDLAQELGVEAFIELLGEVNDVSSWYRRCGVFVLSSRFEGFPNVLLEAMSFGCASIAFDCPSGPRDIVENGTNGLLIPNGSVPGLSAAINALCADPSLRSRVGQAATQLRYRFSHGTITKRWEDLLLRIASSGQ